MGPRQLIAVSFVLTCVRLSDARLRGERVPTYRGVEAQKSAVMEAEPAAEPEREHSSQSAQRADRPQSKPATEPLSWKFPEDPVEQERKIPVGFKLRQPVAANSAAVKCGDSKLHVEVSQDLLGLGKLIKPEEITLGGCSATDIDDLYHVLIFESELHSCGGKLSMTVTSFIYTFTLIYKPKGFNRSPIIRSQNAIILVECHYPRKPGVVTSGLRPSWMSFNDMVAENKLYFSLQLMTNDWMFERTSSKYTVGDVINVQVSIMPHNQHLLRVLVGSCVAVTSPDSTSEPGQAFIKNSGCLSGRKTGSRSRFMPQPQPDKLQFQIEAQETMYISCRLKAIPASSPVTTEHKACYYDEGWRAVRGKDQFCTCCESSCEMRKGQRWFTGRGVVQKEAEVNLGPIVVNQ